MEIILLPLLGIAVTDIGYGPLICEHCSNIQYFARRWSVELEQAAI